MASAVTREEYQSPAVQIADEQFVRRRTKCRVDPYPLGILESLKLVESGPADDAKGTLFRWLLTQGGDRFRSRCSYGDGRSALGIPVAV